MQLVLLAFLPTSSITYEIDLRNYEWQIRTHEGDRNVSHIKLAAFCFRWQP